MHGLCLLLRGDEWIPTDASLIALSQEHGTIAVGSDLISTIKVGDRVLVAPAHACLTGDRYYSYRTLDGRSIARFTTAQLLGDGVP